ncbi:M48 family metallopeptidase [Apibacter adventoris]|uniref:Peptidase M48 Ste24p n=1 Tax=Apibacter adventoris TaxID=1679466 RepID=A0A2S8AE72_9FLAO|nr:M48 family metallopeptidase [Apibacter adventoris]PQL93418.1 peptidase M48 Ste24p [Apibacter adventoris]
MKKILLTMSMACLTIAGFNAQLNKGKIQALSTAAKALTVTDAEVQDAAAASVKWMDEHNATCSTKDKDKKKKAYADRLEKIFGPYKNYDGLKLNYKVYYVIDVNAFASPDGSVRVFSSLMDMMTDDEILGIIGHEIGHVKLGHSKKAYKQALLTAAAAKYAGSTTGSVADLVNSDLGDIATKLTGAQFSQTQESAADDYAYTFMVNNGKDPHALATAFEKIAKLEKEAGADKSTGTKIFSSHPDSEKRVKRVESKIKKDSKK